MTLLSRPARARRPNEWNGGKAVTFFVTLAARRSVTLAALEAGMSRKSAYALKLRDPAFAAAWTAALARRKGNKIDEVEDPPESLAQGDRRKRAGSSSDSGAGRSASLRIRDAERRERFFSGLAAGLPRSAGDVAPAHPLP